MSSIVYLVGAVVIVVFVLKMLGVYLECGSGARTACRRPGKGRAGAGFRMHRLAIVVCVTGPFPPKAARVRGGTCEWRWPVTNASQGTSGRSADERNSRPGATAGETRGE